MPKYRIYSIATASVFLGEFEGDTKEQAIDRALEENPPHNSLCHQCAGEIELGEFYEEQAEEVSDD